jgi:hypothetical protein
MRNVHFLAVKELIVFQAYPPVMPVTIEIWSQNLVASRTLNDSNPATTRLRMSNQRIHRDHVRRRSQARNHEPPTESYIRDPLGPCCSGPSRSETGWVCCSVHGRLFLTAGLLHACNLLRLDIDVVCA